MDEREELHALGRQGYTCSQMLMLKALALQGKENADLVRSLTGFAGGLGWTGGICGVLTGATAVLGLYAGRGDPEEPNDPRLMFMVEDLVRWFNRKFGAEYGGTDCSAILGGGTAQLDLKRCSSLILETFQFVKELLVNNGFDLSGDSLDDWPDD